MFVDGYREESCIFVLSYLQANSLIKVCILIESRIFLQHITVLLQSIKRDSQVFEHTRLVPSAILEKLNEESLQIFGHFR